MVRIDPIIHSIISILFSPPDILSWNRITDSEFDFFKHEIFYLMVIARGWFVSLHFDMDIGKSILSLKYILIKWNK